MIKSGNKTLELNRLPPAHKMTPLEQKVYELYREGKKTKEIAEILGLTVNTVSRRLYNAKDKAMTL